MPPSLTYGDLVEEKTQKTNQNQQKCSKIVNISCPKSKNFVLGIENWEALLAGYKFVDLTVEYGKTEVDGKEVTAPVSILATFIDTLQGVDAQAADAFWDSRTDSILAGGTVHSNRFDVPGLCANGFGLSDPPVPQSFLCSTGMYRERPRCERVTCPIAPNKDLKVMDKVQPASLQRCVEVGAFRGDGDDFNPQYQTLCELKCDPGYVVLAVEDLVFENDGQQNDAEDTDGGHDTSICTPRDL